MNPFANAKVRLALYAVVTAVLALLVVYKLVDPASVPLWASLTAALLGLASSGTATVAVASQIKSDGQ